MDFNHFFGGPFDSNESSHHTVPQLLSTSVDFDMDLEGHDLSQLSHDGWPETCDKIFPEEDTCDQPDLSEFDLDIPSSELNEDLVLQGSWDPKGESSGSDEVDDAAIDRKIYQLFPMEALKKPRTEFGQWKKTYKNGAVRSLTPRETKRLAAIRRVVLARVYAEKARIKKGRETDSMKERLSKLQTENVSLRGRVQNLERILAELQAKFSKAHPQR
eukprot:m.111210 g.111210  ORF g.111210 m.111210 type:complete len:216 (-) comp16999_c0_seq1:231-878(-)